MPKTFPLRRPSSAALTLFAVLLAAGPATADTLTVTDFGDNAAGTPPGTGNGNPGDLRSQMLAAAQGDIITFACNAPPCTITLNGPLPPIRDNLTIDGGATGRVVIDGNNLYRAFFVDTGTVALSNLAIRNVRAKGGNGGQGGGGGGAGLGAGLFVNEAGAVVTVTRVAFSNTTVIGGNGGDIYVDDVTKYGGGGGGGLGGNGGMNGTANSSGPGGGGGGVLGNGTNSTIGLSGTGGAGGGGGGGGGFLGTGGSGYGGDIGGAAGNSAPAGSGGGGGGFGGGGGGAGENPTANGGDGGFGGGGGSGGFRYNSPVGGGAGGPGGGGGGGGGINSPGGAGGLLTPGIGGANGASDTSSGGGGAAAGPAIFVRNGNLTTVESTSIGETATGGGGGEDASPGTASSAAVFNFAGTVNGVITAGPLADVLPAPSFGLTVATAGTGTGTITASAGGIVCPGTCSASILSFSNGAYTTVTLTAAATGGATFTDWSGDCSGAATTATVTMSEARACAARFTAAGGPPAPAPTPTPTPAAPPTPAFVASPIPATLNADTVGAGAGSFSFASSFANPASLSFTATQGGGAPLPSWLTFDPATVSFTYNVPIPADLPIQPLGDGRAARADSRAAWANTVYPLLVRVAEIPVTLNAAGGDQNYSSTIRMSFHAPRPTVAISALSLSLDGALGNGPSGRSALSFDGGQVVFETAATNLFPAAANAQSDIVRYDALSGNRDRLSQTAIPGGGVANAANGASNAPAVSADGRFSAFASEAPGITLIPALGLRQVYRAGLAYPRRALNAAVTPAPDFVSITADGQAGNGPSGNPALSLDGRYVVFESTATNFGPGLDGTRQVWRKDLVTGELLLISGAAGPGNGASGNAAISWDGRWVVFQSTATNLAAGASGNQIYLKDIATGSLRLVSAVGGRPGNAGSTMPRIDGRAGRVVFVTAATNLGFANLAGKPQIVAADLASGAIRLASPGIGGLAANGDSDQPSLSADGRFVAFRSTATDLVAGIAGNGFSQVWLRDIDRGVTALVTQTAAGTAGGGNSANPALAGDASALAFASDARDLVNGNPAAGQTYLAANPLPLPEKTGYWYQPGAANGQGWLMERRGTSAYVGGLVYDTDGRATWATGFCTGSGLTCSGTLATWSGGTAFGDAGPGAPTTTAGPAFSLATAADGRTTGLAVGDAAAVALAPFPIGGTATTAYAGLPQAGWWYEPAAGNSANGYFLAIATQPQRDGSVAQIGYFSVLSFDATGRAVWYAAQARLGADLAFAGTLHQYAGGGSDAAAIGQVRIVFDGTDRASVNLPNGRTAMITRWRF